MKNKILLIVGLVLIIAGCAVSYFANFDNAEILGYAVTMFGAGVASATLWSKRDTSVNIVLSIAGIVCVGAGAFVLGFGGLAETTMTMVMTAIFGVVAVIGGILLLNKKAVK